MVEGRASEFDFIQFYFFTVTYETYGNMTISRETNCSIYKSTRERVDSRN